MGLKDLFSQKEDLIAIDISSAGIKVLEFDAEAKPPVLLNFVLEKLPEDTFANNTIAKPDVVAEKLANLLEKNDLTEMRAVIAMPAAGVFMKRITLPKMPLDEIRAALEMDRESYLPSSVGEVKMDYHVIGEKGKNSYEVLVVASKADLVQSYMDVVAAAGSEVAIVDVDYFALQNCFELSYPELVEKAVVLIDIGARNTNINICRAGTSLFAGNILMGGRLFTEAISSEFGISNDDAEFVKRGEKLELVDKELLLELLHNKVAYVATEINRQVGLFWNAASVDGTIDKILVTGGSSVMAGLITEIGDKTGIDTEALDPFRGIQIGEDVDSAVLESMRSASAVAIGMGIRQFGDR